MLFNAINNYSVEETENTAPETTECKRTLTTCEKVIVGAVVVGAVSGAAYLALTAAEKAVSDAKAVATAGKEAVVNHKAKKAAKQAAAIAEIRNDLKSKGFDDETIDATIESMIG